MIATDTLSSTATKMAAKDDIVDDVNHGQSQNYDLCTSPEIYPEKKKKTSGLTGNLIHNLHNSFFWPIIPAQLSMLLMAYYSQNNEYNVTIKFRLIYAPHRKLVLIKTVD